MIPTNTRQFEVETNATGAKMQMGLDVEDIQHLLPILRDSLYANKVLAPIREYSTNARDSHTARGQSERPIRVTLPTKFEPEFKVRDFGTSLTLEEVKNTYLKYCKSTKRTSNAFNGVYGLGCKSAFAYCDQFNVITYLNGQKTIINIPINGEAIVVAQVPSDEEQGLEIVIPVAIKDVDAWHQEAMSFYAYWSVRPEIINQREDLFNKHFLPLQVKPIFSDVDWEIRPGNYDTRSKAVAVMSFVPYPISWETVKRNLTDEQSTKYRKIFGFVENNLVTFVFPNGTADFTPSREALQYTEVTINTICQKLDRISDAVEKIITEKISSATNIWEAKCLYNKIFNGASYDKTEGNFYGNLGVIQSMLNGKLTWKGIVINDGKFENVSRWDVSRGIDKTNIYSEPGNPLFCLITVEDSIKKTVKVITGGARSGHGSILASEKARVLIIDSEDTYKAAAGRYLLFDKFKDQGVNAIYCFNLSDAQVKKDFYEYYNFDTVPVIYASQIENEVKSFLAANKVVRAAHEQVKAPYIDMSPYYDIVAGKKNEYDISFRWSSDIVPPKDVVQGIYFKATRKCINYLNGTIECDERYRYSTTALTRLLVAFARLCVLTGKKVDRIYGIQPRTVDSKWFKEEVEEGTWIEASEVAKEQFTKLNQEKISLAIEFFEIHISKEFLSVNFINNLIPLIDGKDNLFRQYISLIPSDLKTYANADSMARNLLPEKDFTMRKANVLSPIVDKIKTTYPLFMKLDNDTKIFEENKTYSHTDLVSYASYVNAINTMNLLTEKETKLLAS